MAPLKADLIYFLGYRGFNQNVKDSILLFVTGMCVAGVMMGLSAGYYVIRAQNRMDDRLDRIEALLSTLAQPVPAAPDPHAPSHKQKVCTVR